MKKFITFIAGITCMALLFSGCSLVVLNNPDASAPTLKQTDPNEQIQVTLQTQPVQTDPTAPTVSEPYPQYVQTGINELIVGKSMNKNTWSIHICLPKLVPFNEDAIACQKEIDDFFIPYIEDIRKYSAEGNWPITASIQHMVYLNGNILSLVIQEESFIDDSNFWVYNFDIESGKRLTSQDLLKKLGVTDYTGRLTKLAKERFEQANPKADVALYNERLEKTLAAENISAAMPYLGYNGQIMVVIEIFSTAGGPCYTHTIPFA